jgi:hypothetical protein
LAIPTFDFVPWTGGTQHSVHDAAVGRPLVWASAADAHRDETVIAAAAQRVSAAALNLNGTLTFRTYGLGLDGDDFAYSTGSEDDSHSNDDAADLGLAL